MFTSLLLYYLICLRGCFDYLFTCLVAVCCLRVMVAIGTLCLGFVVVCLLGWILIAEVYILVLELQLCAYT